MKSLYKIIILLSVALTPVSMYAQEDSISVNTACVPVRTVSYDDLAFGPGERMSFAIHYKWGVINSDVGSATVELDTLTFNGIRSFKCTAYGRTAKFYDMFFKVRENFQSWFSCDGLVPLKFMRDTREGNYTARNTYVYDWSSSEPHIAADVYTSNLGEMSMHIPLTRCTYDLPALFYFSRNMDVENIETGRRYPMTFAIDDEYIFCDKLVVAPLTSESDERKVYLPKGNWVDYWTKEPVSEGWFEVKTEDIPVYEKID